MADSATTLSQAALRIVRLMDRFTLAVEAAAVFLGYYNSQVSCVAFLERLRTEGLEGLEDATTDPPLACGIARRA